ncbi:hypothetical protein CH63R_00872 [Colletotrichum higginsianum IMI 349063]|uniref:Uncharacterized protein n=1 Tax=Colletotrichum higginsianum (strain IMI 349063) TaxID=759273 RepID=A0A1B7YUQ7_COLHI|nr:hypothetical protein CH63R_00872 [Colletotrichum higginsianum IMI 349063]OBR15692.1 hypothetical protein CH63R_00872 [Colletotrichum higginsianum IMI 349063]
MARNLPLVLHPSPPTSNQSPLAHPNVTRREGRKTARTYRQSTYSTQKRVNSPPNSFLKQNKKRTPGPGYSHSIGPLTIGSNQSPITKLDLSVPAFFKHLIDKRVLCAVRVSTKNLAPARGKRGKTDRRSLRDLG